MAEGYDKLWMMMAACHTRRLVSATMPRLVRLFTWFRML